MTTKTNEEIVEELYIEHLESLMKDADFAVRYQVIDKEEYYERLRTGSRELLGALRSALTQKDKKTALAVEKERERIENALPEYWLDENGIPFDCDHNRCITLMKSAISPHSDTLEHKATIKQI